MKKNKNLIGLFVILLFLITAMYQAPIEPVTAVGGLGDDLFEDFEGTVFPTWQATGLWHLEDDIDLNPPSGSRFMWYGDNQTGNYDTGSNTTGDLISDNVSLASMSGYIELGFWSRSQTENSSDFDLREVYISNDNGNSWTLLGKINDNFEWEYISFNISAYAGYTIRIKFTFNSVDSALNAYFGWGIDDVIIDQPDLSFGVKHKYVVLQYDNVLIDIAVTNTGYADQEYNISVRINDSLVWEMYSSVLSVGVEEYWSFNYNDTTAVGLYCVETTVISLTFGSVYIRNTYFKVDYNSESGETTSDSFTLEIIQDYEAVVGENVSMTFNAYSNLNYTAYDCYANILINGTNIYSESTITIDPYGNWNVTLYYIFNTSGYYEVLFYFENSPDYYGEAYCYWNIKEGDELFYLEIIQENYIDIGQFGMMEFWIYSYVSYDLLFDINITLIDPYGGLIVVYDEFSHVLVGYDTWVFNYSHQFDISGQWDVFFTITYTNGTFWQEAYCWWNVSDSEEYTDELFLDIIQENYIDIDQFGLMEFFITSNVSYTLHFNINITLKDPNGSYIEIYNEFNHSLAGYDYWYYNYSHYFDVVGYWEVFLTITYLDGSFWQEAYCWWEVGKTEVYFDLEIYQETEIEVNHLGNMTFHISPYNTVDLSATTEVILEDPYGYNYSVFYDESLYFENDTVEYEFWVEFNFTEIGYWQVYFIVYTEFDEWYATCFWNVTEEKTYEYFELIIEQNYSIAIFETGAMTFTAISYFQHDMNVSIYISITDPVNGTIYELYYEPSVTIYAESNWSITLYYYFIAVGTYDVYFELIDDIGVIWNNTCYWDVYEYEHWDEYYDLWIEGLQSEYYIDEIPDLTFMAYSNFSHDMPSVQIGAYMMTPSGYNDTIFYFGSVYFAAYSFWQYNETIGFEESGTYEIFFYLIDDIGAMWMTSYGFEVIDNESVQPTYGIYFPEGINGSTISGEITIEMNISSIHLYSLNITVEDMNSSVVYQSTITFTNNGDYWTASFTFDTTQLSDGDYYFIFEADTEIGLIKRRLLLTVDNSGGTASEGETSSNNLIISSTPGFEGLFFALAMVASAILINKKKRK